MKDDCQNSCAKEFARLACLDFMAAFDANWLRDSAAVVPAQRDRRTRRVRGKASGNGF
jgi:hypothetical protein